MAPNRAFRIHEYGGPEVAWFDDLPAPQPGPGHAVVAIKAVGVNQLDWKMREGYVRQAFPLELPATIGAEFAGEVASIGDSVRRISVGDRVMGFAPGIGAYSELLLVDQRILAHTPDDLSDTDAAAVPASSVTAWQALHAAGELDASRSLLIHGGAGGVGGWAVQFARAMGAKVIATAATPNHPYVRELGATDVIDYHTERFEDRVSSVGMVLDLVGGDTLERSWALVEPGGAVVSVTQPDVVARAPAGKRGLWVSVLPDAALLERIADDVVDSRLQSRVAKVFPLDELSDAIELNRAGGFGPGKLVVDFTR